MNWDQTEPIEGALRDLLDDAGVVLGVGLEGGQIVMDIRISSYR